jgi:glycerophosphoryl diester phosphodiesterase
MITPLRIAHRGASGRGLKPENTLSAFDEAIEIGVDVIEIDVRITGDGKLIVLHDPSLDRTTDRSGLVRDMLYENVFEANAGEGEKVPLLKDVLNLARNRAQVLIELKSDFISETVLHTIHETESQEQVIVQSFNPQSVERFKLMSPSIPSALLVGELPTTPSRLRARRLVTQVLKTGSNILAIWHATITPSLIEEMRQRGIAVWAWTVDDEIAIKDLSLMGVQGIVSNYPDRLNDVLDGLVVESQLQSSAGRRAKPKRSRWARRRQMRKIKGGKQ